METTPQDKPAFDVTLFEAAETGRLEMLGLDDEPMMYEGKPVVFVMYGPGSKQNMAAQAKINAANTSRTYVALRGGKVKQEDARQEQIDRLIACTHSVENWPLSAADTLNNPRLGYMADQLAKYLGDWRNFMKGSTKPLA
jgi:hypothetical protein